MKKIYQGRDIGASLWWLLIVRDHPLWCVLPKDLVRHVLSYFFFFVGKCWCGRYFRKNSEGICCSVICASSYGFQKITGMPIKHGGKRIVIDNVKCNRCSRWLTMYFYQDGRSYTNYCAKCWKIVKRNGLYLISGSR